MENIKYYEDVSCGFLFAYESSTEFFVRFLKDTDEWEACNISFMQVLHDYELREILAVEAMQKANGRLPEDEYNQYINMIQRNLGDI